MSGGARPLRVGVNLLWLVPGVVGGSEEYTTRLLRGLAADPPDDPPGVSGASSPPRRQGFTALP